MIVCLNLRYAFLFLNVYGDVSENDVNELKSNSLGKINGDGFIVVIFKCVSECLRNNVEHWEQ